MEQVEEVLEILELLAKDESFQIAYNVFVKLSDQDLHKGNQLMNQLVKSTLRDLISIVQSYTHSDDPMYNLDVFLEYDYCHSM